MRAKRIAALFCALCLVTTSANAGIIINLNYAAGMTAASQDAFRDAADYWESVLDDTGVEVNLDVDFRGGFASGVLGSASSSTTIQRIDSYLTALTADATSADDATAVANLPTLNAADRIVNRTQVNTEGNSTVVSLDNDDSNNNGFLALNTATAKAVGLIAIADPGVDASIAFNNAFSWDFDQSDGIGAGLQDFTGVAVHEIGHALGFRSGVDAVDASISSGQDLETFAVYTGLDMFRYSAADGVLDLSAGTASYFSIDGGTTNLGLFSTGRNHGDGQQASHWKDNLGLGIMDPTAAPAGNINVVTALDIQAFDVMGWNLAAVPEPGSVAILCVFGACIGLRRRRRPLVA